MKRALNNHQNIKGRPLQILNFANFEILNFEILNFALARIPNSATQILIFASEIKIPEVPSPAPGRKF